MEKKELQAATHAAAEAYRCQPAGEKNIPRAVRQTIPEGHTDEEFRTICGRLGWRGGKHAAALKNPKPKKSRKKSGTKPPPEDDQFSLFVE